MKIKITSDSTCDLSPELLELYDIDVLPKTSASNVIDYITFFSKWVKQGYDVVHYCLGSRFSSTYQNACFAAKECGHVYVVDSENLSTGQGLLVLEGADMAMRGQDADSIYRACSMAAARVDASFIINSLDYLYKGGRCNALAALGANLLRLKPCIEVREGIMLPGKKYRGHFEHVVLQYVKDRLYGRTDIDTHRIFITHTRCSSETVHHVVELVQELIPDAKDILETTAGSTITTHCGPNTLGVLFLRNG